MARLSTGARSKDSQGRSCSVADHDFLEVEWDDKTKAEDKDEDNRAVDELLDMASRSDGEDSRAHAAVNG